MRPADFDVSLIWGRPWFGVARIRWAASDGRACEVMLLSVCEFFVGGGLPTWARRKRCGAETTKGRS